jgi:hypothetical protein
LKHKLQGCFYDSADEFSPAITDLMKILEKSLLRRVFDEWISHLHLVVERGGEYIQTWQKICYSPGSLSKWLSTNFLILTHIHIAALR